ncbi:portal protein [Acinetobacter phage SH-Ab 15599]|nr:portal protein [Acinetobacter phage SH-Ab 15599]
MAGSWIGLTSKKAKDLEKKIVPYQLRATDPLDGSLLFSGFHHESAKLALDGTFQNSSALINEYRDMAMDPDVDMAVDDIINAIVTCEEDKKAVELDFSKVDISEKMMDRFREEFDFILDLMDFNENGYERIRQWYVDGRQYIQPIINPASKKQGLAKLVFLDSRTVQKVKMIERRHAVREGKQVDEIATIKSCFVFNPYWAPEYNTFSNSLSMPAVTRLDNQELNEDSLIYVHSGVKDPLTGVVVSDLEKAKKPLNNLKMLRDAQVIYRLTRSVEKRVFKVDVGSLPPKQAEEQMKRVIREHKTKLEYDPKTGKVNGRGHQQHMLQDFWLPVREGGRGSDVTTLAGAQNLSEIDDILYFQKLLYRSLNTPEGRLGEQQPVIFGNRNAEMTRDEWKFNKFIMRKRKRYADGVFIPLLRVQLISKGVVTEEQWDELFARQLQFKWTSDSWVEDQQETDQLLNRFNNISAVEEQVGKYVSMEWVYENILRFTPEQIQREKERIAKEPKPIEENPNDGY